MSNLMPTRSEFLSFIADEVPMSSADVRNHLSISKATLHRWLYDKDVNFPKPHYVVHQKYFWRYGDVRSWIDAQHNNLMQAA